MTNRLPIKAIKLSSGELLVSFINESKSDFYGIIIVENPVVIQLMQNGDEVSMMLRKWIPYSDDTVYEINKSQIVSICGVNRDLEGTYIMGINKDQLLRQKLIAMEVSEFDSKNTEAQKEFDAIEPVKVEEKEVTKKKSKRWVN